MKFLLAIPLAACLAWGQDDKLQFDEFNARMALESGHLVKGEFRRAGSLKSEAYDLKMVALNRNIIFLDQSASLGEDWTFNAGLMGILWWPFTPEAGPPATRTVRVDPRISIMKARRNLGSTESYLEFGYFPYKYNRDAWNLGEYLYRSGTYPGNVSTSDGYQLMDHPVFDAYGVHARIANLDGVLTHDINLFSEPTYDPIGDITPAYELTLNLPVLQLGVGGAYNRGFSYRPSQTRPKDDDNTYVSVRDTVANTVAYEGPRKGTPDSLKNGPYAETVLSHWTQRGIKLMGRASLDLGFLLPESMRSPDDLRIYAEAAVLGLENQPFYYEKLSQRMPIMFGVNVPTFGVLNLLAFQAEYYDAPFNDTYNFQIASLPVWKVANYQTKDLDSYTPSKWRWSLYGRKSFNRILNLHFQVASDHLRLRDLTTAYTEYEVTLYPKNWYYLLRMEVGI